MRAVACENDKFKLKPLRKLNNRRSEKNKQFFCVNAYFVATAARARNKPMNDHMPPYTPTVYMYISQFVYYNDCCCLCAHRITSAVTPHKTQRQRSKMCKQTFKCGNVHQSSIFTFIRNKKDSNKNAEHENKWPKFIDIFICTQIQGEFVQKSVLTV